MSQYETLQWVLKDHIATITLDRPHKKNAMSWRMFNEIGDVFERAAAETDVRCVVITGVGDGFSSGADLSDPANLVTSVADAGDRMRTIHRIVASFINCPKPTIARVNGIAAGAGANLALGCDLIVASTEASFAELFVKRGLVVDFGGSWVLSRLLPLNRAKELALLGDVITAAQAHAIGIVNSMSEPAYLDAAVDDYARRLCALPPRAVTMIKQNLNRATERSLEQNLDAESLAQTLCITSEDAREAVMAWIDKREPRFTGR